MADKAKEKESKSIAPWRPFMDLTLFERDMERMMDDFFGRRTRSGGPRGGFGRKASRSADLYEEKDDIVVKAELPGMERDNIEVNLTDHTLTLKGEKKRGRGEATELTKEYRRTCGKARNRQKKCGSASG